MSKQESESSAQSYSVSEVSDITGISAYTLRYYDKCHFFPHLKKVSNSRRRFTESDIEQLRFVDALRSSGLSIEGIQYVVRLQTSQTDESAELHRIIETQISRLKLKQEELAGSLSVLEQMEESVKNSDFHE